MWRDGWEVCNRSSLHLLLSYPKEDSFLFIFRVRGTHRVVPAPGPRLRDQPPPRFLLLTRIVPDLWSTAHAPATDPNPPGQHRIFHYTVRSAETQESGHPPVRTCPRRCPAQPAARTVAGARLCAQTACQKPEASGGRPSWGPCGRNPGGYARPLHLSRPRAEDGRRGGSGSLWAAVARGPAVRGQSRRHRAELSCAAGGTWASWRAPGRGALAAPAARASGLLGGPRGRRRSAVGMGRRAGQGPGPRRCSRGCRIWAWPMART